MGVGDGGAIRAVGAGDDSDISGERVFLDGFTAGVLTPPGADERGVVHRGEHAGDIERAAADMLRGAVSADDDIDKSLAKA